MPSSQIPTLKRSKRIYEECKKKGICVYCRIRKTQDGLFTCRKCNKKIKKRINRYSKQKYAKKIKNDAKPK